MTNLLIFIWRWLLGVLPGGAAPARNEWRSWNEPAGGRWRLVLTVKRRPGGFEALASLWLPAHPT